MAMTVQQRDPMDPKVDTPESFDVVDVSGRTLTFSGWLLAARSTERRDSPRWLELELYLSEAGNYTLHKIGRSRVVHSPTCFVPKDRMGNRPKLPRFQDSHPGKSPNDPEFFRCEQCIDDAAERFPMLEIEVDRHFAVWSDQPEKIIDQLYRRSGGARSLMPLSMELLEAASRQDAAIAAAYAASLSI